MAKCTCRAPPAPVLVRMQSTGERVFASMKTTCPDATKEMIAWVCAALNASRCGRTGLAPVFCAQSAATAPARSIFSGAASAYRPEAPAVVAGSPRATEGGYMDVELPSMRSPRYDTVYGIGDVVAPTIGLGMAGVFAHFQAEHVATQILDEVRGGFMGELYNMVGVCV